MSVSLRIALAAWVGLSPGLAAAETEPPWEWRFMGGASIDPAPHGIADLGVRRDALSLQLLTDTLDLRWAPEGDRGRAWLALRAEAGAVGLVHSPWHAGRPAPERGFSGSYVGGEAGALRYLPRGVYAGVGGFSYRTSFAARPATEVEVPGPTPWLGVDGIVGRWSEVLHVWGRVGLQHDRLGDPVQPHAHLTATSRARRAVGHRAELRAGWAQGQSLLTRTRIGGLNPYVVPVAGAGWAEWWAESYVVGRAGPQVRRTHRASTFTHSLVVDAGWADDTDRPPGSLWGVGSLNRWDGRRWFVQADVGWGGGLQRATGVVPWAGNLLVGRPWG